MADVSRRGFLRAGGSAAAAAATLAAGVSKASALSTLETTLPYPRTRIGNLNQLQPGTPVTFAYPDAASQGLLVKLGEEALEGIGPGRDVVAYSVMCTHKGCSVAYNSTDKILVCPCHFSTFDPAKNGMMVIGQATERLPRIELALDTASGDIFAVGIQGLLYGRAANVLTT